MTGTAPPPPQIPAGRAPLPADINAWVTTPFTFLTSKTVFRGQLQGGEALSAGVFTLAKLDTVLEDPYSDWSATATGSQPAWSWLCPAGCSGWYEISTTALTNSTGTAGAWIGAQVYVSGAQWSVGSLSWGVNGNTSGSSGCVQVPLIGGSDYVQLYLFSTVALSTPTASGRFPEMEIQWISS